MYKLNEKEFNQNYKYLCTRLKLDMKELSKDDIKKYRKNINFFAKTY